MRIPENVRAYKRGYIVKKQTEGKQYFFCGACPVCGRKGIPRGRGEDAYCVCPIHGAYDANYTDKPEVG